MKSLFSRNTLYCVMTLLLLWLITRILPVVPSAGWIGISVIGGAILSWWLIYKSIISSTKETLTLKRKGILSFIFNCRSLIYAFSIGFATIVAFYSLFLLSSLHLHEWLYILPILPIYGICRLIVALILNRESADWVRASRLGTWSIWLSSSISLIVFFWHSVRCVA